MKSTRQWHEGIGRKVMNKRSKPFWKILIGGAFLHFCMSGNVFASPNNPIPDDPFEQKAEIENRMKIAESFLTSPYSGVWSGDSDTFRNTFASFDEMGRVVVRYERYYNGLQILDSAVKLFIFSNDEVSFSFLPEPVTPPVQTNPRISYSKAWNTVADDMIVARHEMIGEQALVLIPQPNGDPARLAWQLKVSHSTIPPRRYLVDAVSGEILLREKAYAEALNLGAGSGTTTRGTSIAFDDAYDTEYGAFTLIDPTRGYSHVLDMQENVYNSGFHGELYYDQDNAWGNGLDWRYGDSTTDATGQTVAVDTIWGLQRTWDTLENVFSHQGFNGLAEPMIARVHVLKEAGRNFGDAFFYEGYIHIGDGNEDDSLPNSSLNTIAHELGHGFWWRTVTTNQGGEISGLNEGHGDIMSALVKHYTELANSKGNYMPTNAPGDASLFRYRSINPWSYRVGDNLDGLAVYVNDMPNIEEHRQGTAYGHMFAILAIGAPSKAVADADPCDKTIRESKFNCLSKTQFPLGMAGIGLNDASRIWYLATTAYLDSTPTFHEARDAYLQAADDVFGSPSPQYAAVMNAFYVINVGEPATDFGPPEISADPVVVDNNERTVFLNINTTDDIGTVNLKLSTPGESREVSSDSFTGYMYAGTVPGNRNVEVIASDAFQNSSQSSLPFVFTSDNHLFLSNFDDLSNTDGGIDTEGWYSSNETYMFVSDPSLAFLGDGAVRLYGNHYIEREVEVPADATSIAIGFRYRVDQSLQPGDGSMRVQLVDMSDNVLETLDEIFWNEDTTSPYSNNFFKIHITAAGSYAGQTIKVRFRGANAINEGFWIDQAYMTYDATPVSIMIIEADETEGSVIFTPAVSGISLNRIYYAAISVNGLPLTEHYVSPYQAIFSTSDFAHDMDLQGAAMFYDHFGNVQASSGNVDFRIDTINKRIANGGFENGDAYWSKHGDVDLCGYNPESGEGSPAFIGTGCMMLTGEGTLSQVFTIPGNAQSAKTSFRLKNRSQSGFGTQIKVKVYNNANGQLLALLLSKSGNTNTDLPPSDNGYRKFTYDLTPFKGKELKLQFSIEETGADVHTEMYLDNIGASYTVSTPRPGGLTR